MFDYLAMAFYAAVCGTLAIFAPSTGGMLARAGIGIFVGLVAATILPMLKGMVGY
jgi:hypothetical protein